MNIISRRFARDEYAVRKRYMINHPVVRLLEKNMRSMDVKDIFMNEEGIETMKDFEGTTRFSSGNKYTRMLEELPPLSGESGARTGKGLHYYY